VDTGYDSSTLALVDLLANHQVIYGAQLDKLVISQVGFLAQKRLARGVKLNHGEATVRNLTLPCYFYCHPAPSSFNH
jgi:hypothetical protein